jgi:hypothetical protein
MKAVDPASHYRYQQRQLMAADEAHPQSVESTPSASWQVSGGSGFESPRRWLDRRVPETPSHSPGGESARARDPLQIPLSFPGSVG